MGPDNKKYLPLLNYLHNNTTKALAGKELADKYPVVARKIRQVQKILTEQERACIVTEYNDGVVIDKLASRYNCSPKTISRLLKSRDVVVVRKKASTRGREAEIVRLYNSGLSTIQIGAKIGIGTSTVRRCLRDHGVRLRLPSSRKL